ncbi:MAG: formylglycine-generating enzyme family protein, partial [Planctomycetota bacterium]|nr:formylglycine-generating enzyme family protein [Planctomycetota bacterium]
VTFSRESLPSRFLRDGRNVIAAEVHLGGHAAHGLRFELELRRGQETLVRRSAVWRYLDHGAPPHAAWKTAGYDDGEWPAGPAPLGYGFADGPGRWRELRREVDSLTEKISGLEAEIAERRTWNFATREDRWEHDSRSQLVADLEEFLDEDPATGTVASVNERLGFAETITRRSLEDHRGEWDAARASIRDPSRCPFYKGLELEPQLGVVPIGRDPASRLWEFWHVRSGERPERDEEGQLVLTEESGIVFVRIPGGTFRMGSPAYPDEKPVREVTLGPFFISRYEMTQGQWLRVSHGNPSAYGPDRDHFGYQHSLLHPVEQISWPRCRQVLEHLGLILPTEAQWEYAARAGTTTVWWTGDDETSLSGAANLADTYCKQNHGPLGLQYEEWLADGYTTHAPVGSFRANDFGLHDVVGNVLEWTRDARVSYEETPREGDGLRTSDDATLRVCRGGSWYLPAENARSAIRTPYRPDSRGSHLGVRPAREITE